VFDLVLELPVLYSSGAAYSDCYISAPGCVLSLPDFFDITPCAQRSVVLGFPHQVEFLSPVQNE